MHLRSIQGRVRALADVLRRDWDPIGGGKLPDLPVDEYDAYAPAVAAAIERGDSDLGIAALLCEVEREDMGLTPHPPDRWLAVAATLRWSWTAPPLSDWLLPNLESFVGERMFAGGEWPDGVRMTRVIVDGPALTRVFAQLWTIDQRTHTLCAEVSATRGRADLDWELWLDPILTARAELNAIHTLDDPRAVGWASHLTGTMTL